jgi:hypothetical protein
MAAVVATSAASSTPNADDARLTDGLLERGTITSG